ncbi:O-antigen ligase family protein [Bacillus fonticola]|uniref:O-antigen ligase family protein n=1 Tax=Bacillus fonticola TaxID=2728853 RepID=UPI001474D163|nr:O-antigen ligase family protein [Bacillus fonticola]
MLSKHSLTYYVVLISLFVIPLVSFKTYIGPLPASAEVVLIPLLTLVFLYEYKTNKIHLNDMYNRSIFLAFLIFIVISLLSFIDAVNLVAGAMEFARFLSYVVLFFIVTRVKFSAEEYRTLGKVFAATVVLVGLYGLAQYVFDFNLNKAGLYALDEAKGRVFSTFINPNYYSAFMNFVIPVTVLFAVVYAKKPSTQLIIFAVYAVFVVNVIFTYTRAAWVTMAAAFILLVLVMPKPFLKNAVKPQIIIAFALLLTTLYFLPDVQSRTSSAIYAIEQLSPIKFGGGDGLSAPGDPVDPGSEGSEEEDEPVDENTERAVVSRTVLWKTGWYMLRDNPVLGVGMGNYRDNYLPTVQKYPELYIGHDVYSVHNSYLKVGAETGFPGLIAFLFIYIAYYFVLIKLYFRQRSTEGKVIAAGLFVGSVCYLVQNLSNNLIFIPQMNVIFWLVSGVAFAYLHQQAKQTSSLT